MDAQARLHVLCPGLMEDGSGGEPGWLQWAFACVRSRAFCLGPDRFAFVPFLDVANHAAEPRGAFREAGDAVELVALAGGVEAGQQVTISYSGERGCLPAHCQAQDLAIGQARLSVQIQNKTNI